MKELRHTFLTAVTLLISTASAAQNLAPGDKLSFVACPIMQDTNTVPCWVTEHEGEKYFLGIQTDSSGWSAPFLKHRILVEGTVADMPRVCGGIVLESSGTPFDRGTSGKVNGFDLPNPPVTSNLREVDLSCNTILPATDKFNNLEPRRGPGPNIYRAPPTAEQQAAARARAEAQRKANTPVAPYQPRTFPLYYEFDSELSVLFINRANTAIQYAAAIAASTIRVTGYRASSLLSDGSKLTEQSFMSRRRAMEVVEVLRQLGIPEGTKLAVSWVDDAIEGNGADDWKGRTTEIEVLP